MNGYYLAIDIGASSGRHIVGWREEGAVRTKEVYRFPNGAAEAGGHLTWDVDALLAHVKAGIQAAVEAFGRLESFSIDTWGVDYMLLKGEEEVRPCYAYRDSRTQGAIQAVHEKTPFAELYRRTGIQFQPFNTIYQLYDDLQRGRLEGVTDFLLLPQYLLWRLTGVKAWEYTSATTTGLVDAATGAFDLELVRRLGLPEHLFPALSQPGTPVGAYRGIQAVLCPSHDTAAAVEGIPMEGEQLYLSSGTWSLLGVKAPGAITNDKSRAANYSNEGGVGYIRYQKNIMGMWVANRLREELCPDKPFPAIIEEARASTFTATVDVDAPCFLAPESMKAAFDGALGVKPQGVGDYFSCAYRSLAAGYRAAIDELEENTGRTYGKLYIVGGGAKNDFLNQLTRDMTGKEVLALPIEATALGNLKIQMEGK